MEEELPTLVALAELRRRQGDHKAASELLDDVWEPAERGPFRLFHVDACNVLAQFELLGREPLSDIEIDLREEKSDEELKG